MINQHLRRDPMSGGVVNTDSAALNKYKMERKLHRRVESLTKELDDVKSILNAVCEKLEKIEI